MILLEPPTPLESTSAAGALPARPSRKPVLVGLMLAGLGTSAATALPADMVSRLPQPAQQTTSGLPVLLVEHAARAIAEVRRLSGLTWDQLARLFKVSRRSLHLWASGRAMAPKNEEHLHRVLAVLRKIDRGAAAANRTALLSAREDGLVPLDLFAEREFEAALAVLGHGQGASRLKSPVVTEETRRARTPRVPEELVDALQDRVHREAGRARVARSARRRSGR
jgi:DNA-binding transcriptional regulator YiaG